MRRTHESQRTAAARPAPPQLIAAVSAPSGGASGAGPPRSPPHSASPVRPPCAWVLHPARDPRPAVRHLHTSQLNPSTARPPPCAGPRSPSPVSSRLCTLNLYTRSCTSRLLQPESWHSSGTHPSTLHDSPAFSCAPHMQPGRGFSCGGTCLGNWERGETRFACGVCMPAGPRHSQPRLQMGGAGHRIKRGRHGRAWQNREAKEKQEWKTNTEAQNKTRSAQQNRTAQQKREWKTTPPCKTNPGEQNKPEGNRQPRRGRCDTCAWPPSLGCPVSARASFCPLDLELLRLHSTPRRFPGCCR